jgi:hypothetical protein
MNWTEEEYTELLKRRGKAPGIEKESKYHSKRIKVDGIYFDSQLEADKYNDLKLQLRMGTIAGFCRQAEFILQEGFAVTKPIAYRADFIVFLLDGTFEIIDTKGVEIEVFKIKKKMFVNKFPKLDLKIER